MIKAKAETFDQYREIWDSYALYNRPEGIELWEMIKVKAETFDQWQWVWEHAPNDSSEKAEALTMLEALARKG